MLGEGQKLPTVKNSFFLQNVLQKFSKIYRYLQTDTLITVKLSICQVYEWYHSSSAWFTDQNFGV